MVSQYDEVATGRTKQAGNCFSFIYILLGCFGVTGLIDPFKDTSGPSINILIKLTSMVSIVFAGLIVAVHLL